MRRNRLKLDKVLSHQILIVNIYIVDNCVTMFLLLPLSLAALAATARSSAPVAAASSSVNISNILNSFQVERKISRYPQ